MAGDLVRADKNSTKVRSLYAHLAKGLNLWGSESHRCTSSVSVLIDGAAKDAGAQDPAWMELGAWGELQ